MESDLHALSLWPLIGQAPRVPALEIAVDAQLFLLCVLTFVIHLIGALAYAVRIAGVRTRRIAMSFALFNVLVLLSRASNAFQGPFLSKRIETEPLAGTGQHLLADFQWLRASASLAAIIGNGLLMRRIARHQAEPPGQARPAGGEESSRRSRGTR